MEQGLGPYLIISATKPAISLPTSLRPCHMFTKAGMAWPWHEHNVMQLGMSFRICELLNTNHRLWQEEACIKGNQAQRGASKFHKPLQQKLIRQWSKNYNNDMKSSCPRRPSRVVADPWLFNPSARNFLPERLPGWAIWWLGSHPAQQSFGQHPSWPNAFHSCLAFPGRPALPVQQTAAWAGMPTTQEHSGLKCFGMVVTSARNYPAKQPPWSGLGG